MRTVPGMSLQVHMVELPSSFSREPHPYEGYALIRIKQNYVGLVYKYQAWLLVKCISSLPPSARPTTELEDALSKVRAKWYDLGLRLGVPDETLDAIKSTQKHVVEDCMRAMLQTWQGQCPERDWSDIVRVLREMHRNDVADEVERKYCTNSPPLPLQQVQGITYSIDSLHVQ